jgi:hypothetical protein
MIAYPGDIGFSINKKNVISKVMAWFMGSKWSHSLLIFDQGKRQTYTLETSDFEVYNGDLERYLLNKDVAMEIWRPNSLDHNAINIVLNESHKSIGKTYGYLQLLSFAVRCLFKKIGIKIPHFIQTGIVCNQVVLLGYVKSGLPELSIDPKSIDTEELYQIIKTSPHFTKVLVKD